MVFLSILWWIYDDKLKMNIIKGSLDTVKITKDDTNEL